jgi:hypothetical protein
LVSHRTRRTFTVVGFLEATATATRGWHGCGS